MQQLTQLSDPPRSPGRLVPFRFRQLGEQDRDFNQAFLVADGTGVLHRPQSELYDGTLNFNDPGQAKVLLERFEELWEQSAPDPELRRLHV